MAALGRALRRLGTDAAPAVPALVQCLGDREADARRDAAKVLAELGKRAVSDTPALAASPRTPFAVPFGALAVLRQVGAQPPAR